PQIAAVAAAFKAQGVLASIGARTRLVTHLDVTPEDVDQVLAILRSAFRQADSAPQPAADGSLYA
ncbi:MAG: hypothetical protein NTX56_05740, partial [Proteobacteria bacterium]|nr:hypothetical protein [Pseudomonadota bacterium]